MPLIKTKARESLKNWTTFNEELLSWSLKDLKSMLKYERSHQQRKTFIDRLIKRIGKMTSDAAKEEA